MKILHALVVMIMMSAVVHAEGLVVVASPDSPLVSLNGDELAKLYLGQVSADSQGRPLTVYDLDDATVRGEFYRATLAMSLIQLRAYRAKQVFTGRGRPPRQLSVDDLIARLQQDGQAVGYLPAEQADGLTILHRF